MLPVLRRAMLQLRLLRRLLRLAFAAGRGPRPIAARAFRNVHSFGTKFRFRAESLIAAERDSLSRAIRLGADASTGLGSGREQETIDYPQLDLAEADVAFHGAEGEGGRDPLGGPIDPQCASRGAV